MTANSPPVRVGGFAAWDSDCASEEFPLYPSCEGKRGLYPSYLWKEGRQPISIAPPSRVTFGRGEAPCLYHSPPQREGGDNQLYPSFLLLWSSE